MNTVQTTPPVVNVKLTAIDRDASIQCRAEINLSVVTDYAERMVENDAFPPVDLYGTEERCWIGDGWHRIQAAEANDFKTISAILHPGGRSDALKHALGANATHGHRRSNADKRRSIEIALREFPKLSDNAIAKLCAVSDKTVAAHRPVSLGNSEGEKRSGLDGKSYPSTRAPSTPQEADDPPRVRTADEEMAEAEGGQREARPKITAKQRMQQERERYKREDIAAVPAWFYEIFAEVKLPSEYHDAGRRLVALAYQRLLDEDCCLAEGESAHVDYIVATYGPKRPEQSV